MKILLTGGAGYIGSHTAVVLSQVGHNVVLLDNFCNSERAVVQRIGKILGKELSCIELDVRETSAVEKVLRDFKIEAVIHFAGLKSVAQSVQDPVLYYDNNVAGTISLIQAMQANGIYRFIFSSSATVYGTPQYLPYDEAHPTNPINPYGQTKLQVEEILADLAKSDSQWAIACLRYFNPVGAHPSHLIGELPNDRPNNLMPFITQVASKQRPFLTVYGNDYETKDGTGERDYIHVMDLAEGHAAALKLIENQPGNHILNLGTGKPYSVLKMIHTFEKATGQTIPIQIGARRDGDLPIYYASADKAKALMQWEANRPLADMCESSWKFQEQLHNDNHSGN